MSNQVVFPLISGARVRMFRGGGGETILFLHGGSGLSVWTPFFEKLSGSYDLYIPEHPGFGQSDNPEWLNSVSDLVLFYLDFIDALGLDGVHLIGNSFGGWIAAELAVRDRSRLRSLTLIGPAGLEPSAGPIDTLRWSYEISTRNLFYDQSIADRALGAVLTLEQLSGQLKNQATMARLGAASRFTNPDLGRWLHRIDIPVHIIWGEHDRLSPSATAGIWQSHIPGSHLTIIDGAGHLPHAEKPDIVGAAIAKFLAACPELTPCSPLSDNLEI